MTGALTLAWVEGTYLGTTVAISRQEHVAVAGLDGRARATMVVDDSTIRWEREGSAVVRLAVPQLQGVSLERSLADLLLGRARLVRVEWKADRGEHGKQGEHGDRNVTRFLPRARADSAALVSAVQRLMEFGPSIDDLPTTPDGTP